MQVSKLTQHFTEENLRTVNNFEALLYSGITNNQILKDISNQACEPQLQFQNWSSSYKTLLFGPKGRTLWVVLVELLVYIASFADVELAGSN